MDDREAINSGEYLKTIENHVLHKKEAYLNQI